MNHGFLRASNGTVTEFDVPAAATGPGLGTTTAWAQCVNPAGAVTGYYFDQNGAIHGYVRNPDGTIATFDAPGAGTGSGQGLTPGPSTRRGQPRGLQITTASITACCAPATARSLYLTLRARALALAKVPRSKASTDQA